jgi:hypothetical protein
MLCIQVLIAATGSAGIINIKMKKSFKSKEERVKRKE